jgi:hypothetical protein
MESFYPAVFPAVGGTPPIFGGGWQRGCLGRMSLKQGGATAAKLWDSIVKKSASKSALTPYLD